MKNIPYDEMPFWMFTFDEMANSLIAQGKDIIKLALGVPELPIPNSVVDEYVSSLNDHNRMQEVHPTGLPQLKEVIAKLTPTVSPDHILIHNGTSPLHQLLYSIVAGQDDFILIPKPYYPLYLMSAYLSGAKSNCYDIDLETGRIDRESLTRRIQEVHPSLIVINSPGNPLGNVLPEEDLRFVLETAEEDTFVLFDEVYSELFFESSVFSARKLLNEFDNIIIANGFSKSKRMYTLRIGYVIVPEKLLSITSIAMRYTALTVNPAVQYAAICALEDRSVTTELISIYRERRNCINDILSPLVPMELFPKAGMYATLKCDSIMKILGFRSSELLAKDILRKAGVAVAPGVDFGLPTSLRISFSNSRFEKAVERLYDYFSSVLKTEISSLDVREKK